MFRCFSREKKPSKKLDVVIDSQTSSPASPKDLQIFKDCQLYNCYISESSLEHCHLKDCVLSHSKLNPKHSTRLSRPSSSRRSSLEKLSIPQQDSVSVETCSSCKYGTNATIEEYISRM